ncbi:bifunctional adenosylcobinamide kinase/adenosylcobinamide-phosphate guanylyltransferase [Desulfovibrio sp. TomC]|uniref:bifunctional adenosylcobinamide kinase/adenosylcobinamide-phosphate guanylyltransferase n=1 Tax=Desulfovibrio sp. TomC TaxID=1562888 RepID=UPI0005754656|nr:bifunctional adenosylcobinamide kinase/adenosylcobinamide-phosphate guanylyltransferase [Desulfovibrio sp. TomC]KHK01610.1 Adenosylcobinamide-phosphate guanylyltransferase [Desulfovibrio sp. TomC]
MIRLLLGGTRSGKSGHGEALLAAGPLPHRVVATGRACDFAFRERINAHKRVRDPRVAVIEAGAEAMDVLAREAAAGGTVLLDSLDFWLFACHGDTVEANVALARGFAPYGDPGGPELIVVSAETGLGPVAGDAATRQFIDALGALNQAAAALAHDVRLIAAGLSVQLKGNAP